jgi:hypothetical protein
LVITTRDTQWWNEETRGGDPHPLVFSLFDTIKARQETLLANTRRLICIYQWGYKAGEQSNPEADAPFNDDVVGFNCAQNTVDTMLAKLCATRVVPMPLTDGGGYLERKRAKDLGHALEGEWDENDVESAIEDATFDALVTSHGAGAIKVFPRGRGKNERVCVEHVPIDDLFFDHAEVRYRKPRSVIQRQRMDRFVALAEFGKEDKTLCGTVAERRDAILAAPEATTDAGMAVEANQIEVVECWHLPSDGGGEDDDDEDGEDRDCDGRHFIGISSCTFVDEEWEQDCLPFALYVPRRRARHVLGLSLMWNLAAPQREYEKLSYRVQKAHHLMGGTHLYVQLGSNIDVRELDNGQGTIVTGDGAAPTEFNPTPVNPQTYEYKESIARDMNTKNGLSEMSVSSQVPAGLSHASGKALQVFEDTEDKRLILPHRAKERLVTQLAWLIVECARAISERNPTYKARYRSKRGVEALMWKDVLIDRDKMVLKVFPVSNLSKQPSARFEQLTEMLNAGALTIEQFKRLFDLPDLESESEIDSADTDIIDFTLDKIVTTGKYISPEPFDDLQLAMKRCGKFINLCRKNDVPDARLKLLHNYFDDCKSLTEMSQPQAPPGAPPGPPGAGGPPPGMTAPPGTPGAPGLPGGPPMPDQPMIPPAAAA